MGEASAHRSVGDDPEPEEGFELAHQRDKVLTLFITEDELPVHDSGKAVVIAQALASDARLSHRSRIMHI